MNNSTLPKIGDYVVYHSHLGQIIEFFTGPNDLNYARLDVEGDRGVLTQVAKLQAPATLWQAEN
jgi:hypothetical protein